MFPPTFSKTMSTPRDVGPTYDRNLYALRRQDTSITSIITRFSHARCELDGGVSVDGKLVIYERHAYPTRGFAILNDMPSRDIMYIQNLCSEDDLSVDGQHIVVTSRPHSLAHKWSLFDDTQSYTSFDALLDGSPSEQVSVYLLVDDDDFFMLSCSLQSAIRASAFIPTGTKMSLSRLLTPLNTLPRSITTFTSPISPLESPTSARFDYYHRDSPYASPSRSMQSSPYPNSPFIPSPEPETVDKSWISSHAETEPVPDGQISRDSDSSRLALLQKVFGDI